MKKINLVLILSILFIFTESKCQSGFNIELNNIEDSLKVIMDKSQIPGLSIAIYKNDFIWKKGYGYADIENKILATPETSYILASTMKAITALAIVKLADIGKIDLNKEIQEYVPYYPKKNWPVTVRQVLDHLAGIGWKEDKWKECTDKIEYSTHSAVALFKNDSLLFEPGTQFQYSSFGYILLGALIEEVTQEPFEKYMTENIWIPLDMKNTQLDNNEIILNRARGYSIMDNEIKNSDFVNNSLWLAAGGGRSTVIDMINFARGLDQGKILSKEKQQIIYKSSITKNGKNTSYGMGCSFNSRSGFLEVVAMGAQPGTSTMILRVPKENFAVAIACNLSYKHFEIYKIAHYAAELFIK